MLDDIALIESHYGPQNSVHDKVRDAWFRIKTELVVGQKPTTNKPIMPVCPKCGGSKWRTDGMHSNEFCSKCFTSKPGKPA